jgi:hypothetical protein
MLNRIVTGDESWVHHYQLESKCASLQLKYSRSHSNKKPEVQGYVIRWEVDAYRFGILREYC